MKKTFDICIRSDSSLDARVLPTVMAKDYALILVCMVCSHLMLCNLCYSS